MCNYTTYSYFMWLGQFITLRNNGTLKCVNIVITHTPIKVDQRIFIQVCLDKGPFQCCEKTSILVILSLRFTFLEAAVVAMSAVISKARDGFFDTFFAIFLDTLSPSFPKLLQKSERRSDWITLSETIIDFRLSQIIHFPNDKLFSLPVF